MKKPLWRRGVALAVCFFALQTMVTHASTRTHGLSSFGELKYPADFKHFDYVNPDAPKGGRMATIGTSAVTTFNHFNGFILGGNAAEGLGLLFDTLMTRAEDEPDAMYGLAAEAAEVADDKRSATFYLRPEARFADGTPVTPADVVFSLKVIKEKGHPRLQAVLRDVTDAVAVDATTVRYMFQGDNLRDLPLIAAGLPILSRAYYTSHDFLKETLDPPLGSGPYAIADYGQGKFVTYRRRADYWAANLPVNRGRYNFGEVRYDYYRDRSVALEAFKAHAYDLREEFTSKSWATEYNFPAVASGQVKLLTLPDGRPSGTQGFFMNTRRDKFKDIRLRRALDYAFDFEWTNKSLFYGAYTRTVSFFENSDLKAAGQPAGSELSLLDPYKDRLPPEVFGDPYVPPVTDGSGRFRPNIRLASQLLDEAGWQLSNGERKNTKEETLGIDFLIEDPTMERFIAPYAAKLSELGIHATLTRIDAAQEQERLKTYDFDMMMTRFSLSPTPGPEMRAFFNSELGRQDGSENLAGVADPVVDALLDKIAGAQSRADLSAACRALDRVLRSGHYWVSEWFKNVHTIATWDVYSYPPVQARYSDGVIDTWWYDAAKAQKLGG